MSSLLPVVVDGLFRIGAGTAEAEGLGDRDQLILVSDVAAFLKECSAQPKADLFPSPVASTIRRPREPKSWQRRQRKMVGVESSKEIRRDDLSEGVDFFSDKGAAERLSVDQLEGPSSDAHNDVVAAAPCALGDESPKADVGERTPHIREYLQHRPGYRTATSHDTMLPGFWQSR
jgi:hypothetical protein